MTDHIATAVNHLSAVAETREHLHNLYETQKRKGLLDETRGNLGAQIAEAHQSIGYGLKAASIHAEIAQAEALRLIAMGDRSKAVTL